MVNLVHNVQKKQHKERSQVLSRDRFGLLEKKKDYKLRSNDYHQKQNALKALKLKAQAYNPDEYYHAMTRRKTDDAGVLLQQRGSVELNNDQLKLLKTQDISYIRTLRLNELSKIERQKHDLDLKAGGKHTVFVDSLQEQAELTPEAFFNTDTKLLARRENRLKLSQLQSNEKLIKQEQEQDQKVIDEQNKDKLKRLRLLQLRLKREKELKEVEFELELKTELMKKGGSRKLKDGNGKVYYKWQNERKR